MGLELISRRFVNWRNGLSSYLQIADAGGVDALVSGNEDKVGRITVGEKLLVLERLNPTPRPTTY
jgi:hypothetical protein